jgi:26S proteasome regulatory subunit N1
MLRIRAAQCKCAHRIRYLAVADDDVSMEIAAPSTLALGFVFVGSRNGEITSVILQTLTDRDDKALGEKWR